MTHGVQRGAHEALADLTLPPGDTDLALGPLAARRVRVDPWAATKLDAGAAQSSVRGRLSALSSFAGTA